VSLDPGEALRVANGAAIRESTPFAETLDPDTSEIGFAPQSDAIPPWSDFNPQRFSARALQGCVCQAMESLWPAAATRALREGCAGPLRRLFDRRAILQIEVATPQGPLTWHVARWHPDVGLVAGAHADPDYVYQFIGSELLAYATTTHGAPPRVRARRRRSASTLDGRFALGALDPARLSGLDPVLSVDETYDWHPLELLADVGDL
jgi:hypothetical protein